jgi:carboxylesterase type B
VHDTSSDNSGYGVTHTVEVHAIWGPQNTKGSPASYSTYNAAIVPIVQGYWTSFIRTGGDPNKYRATGSPTWEEWTGSNRLRFEVGGDGTAMEDVGTDQAQRCAWWRSNGVSLEQ